MQFYRHSGAVTLGGLVMATLAGVLTASILGIAYTFLIVFIPWVQLNFLTTLGFGAAIGFMVGHAAKTGKIRNPIVLGMLGFIFGLVGLYVAWGTDLIVRSKFDDYIGAFHPLELVSYMTWLYENGSWAMREGSDPVKGLHLAAIWLCEAGFIIGMAAALAYRATTKLTFCEHCHTWNPVEKGVHSLTIQEGQEPIFERISSGEVTALGELFLASAEDDAYLRVDLSCCPTCSQSNYLSIQMVTHTIDKNGELKTKEKPLFENLAVSSEEVEFIREAGQPLPEMEPPAENDEPNYSAV